MEIESFEKQFVEIVGLIKQARYNAVKNINKELIDLYWRVGEYVSKKILSAEWGDKVVRNLSKYIEKNVLDIRGFSVKNIWRMKQFYETYQGVTIVSALLRQLSWTNNLLILAKCETPEEREFYIRIMVWTRSPLDKA